MTDALWKQMQSAFQEWDGALLDLYALNANPEVWQQFLGGLRAEERSVRFTVDGVEQPLPLNGSEIFALRSQASPGLEIRTDRLLITCAFFSESWIELEIDPREVKDEPSFQELLQFMQTLSRWCKRDVLLTLESSPELVLLRYSAATGAFQAGAFHEQSPLL